MPALERFFSPRMEERADAPNIPLLSKSRARLPAVVALLTGLCLSTMAFAFVWQWEEKQSNQEFASAAQSHFRALQRGLDEYIHSLKALKAFFEVSQNVNRDQFETFAGRLLADQKGVQNFSWVPVVTSAERSAFEAETARSGLPEYRIRAVTPDDKLIISPDKNEYLPILYSTVPRASRIYGIDLLSQPGIQKRVERARDEDALSAVPEFILHSKEGDVRGFLFSLPVYRQGQPVNTVEERRQSLLGFAHGAFLTADAIEHILDKYTTSRGLDLAIFLSDSLPSAFPIYVHSSRMRTSPAEPRSLATLQEVRHEVSKLSTASTNWTLIATGMENGPLSTKHVRAWLVLLAGLLVTGGITQYLIGSVDHAMALKRANDEISNLARRDPLTGLYNRRAFNEFLSMSYAAAHRGSDTFSILSFDIDHFKQVNDTLGHPAGDSILQQVAQRVLGTCRQTDVFARFGGDEFAILQPSADTAAACSLATRITDIMGHPFDIGGRPVRVTASIGVAQFSNEAVSYESLLVQADRALYEAKTEGKNRFRVWNEESA